MRVFQKDNNVYCLALTGTDLKCLGGAVMENDAQHWQNSCH